jgi:amidase
MWSRIPCLRLTLALGAYVLVFVTSSDSSVQLSQTGTTQVVLNPFPYNFPDPDVPDDSFPMPNCFGHIIEEKSIRELQGLLSNGSLSSRQLLRCYSLRISQVDPYIKSVGLNSSMPCVSLTISSSTIMELNPDAEEIADILDHERAHGHIRGLLHGIPFLVKDNIATQDRMQTTAGSFALLGSVVPRDAHVVKLLREAGALLLGHATLSEWADMRSNIYSEGYSARGGQARSPYNATLMPGGSSTGSAGSVSANECSFSLGTETDGSVINAAERAGIVGLKPTVGLTSRAGVIPESEHQDTVGVFGRTVEDAAAVLGVIAGIDPRDNYTLAQEGHGRAYKGQSSWFR